MLDWWASLIQELSQEFWHAAEGFLPAGQSATDGKPVFVPLIDHVYGP